MSSYHSSEDVWSWACTSLGLHRSADQARAELPPYRPDEARRALDRLYRRRRLAPEQILREGHHTDVRVRRQALEHMVEPLRGFGRVNDAATALVGPYPHV
jgi:hypothetical protein